MASYLLLLVNRGLFRPGPLSNGPGPNAEKTARNRGAIKRSADQSRRRRSTGPRLHGWAILCAEHEQHQAHYSSSSPLSSEDVVGVSVPIIQFPPRLLSWALMNIILMRFLSFVFADIGGGCRRSSAWLWATAPSVKHAFSYHTPPTNSLQNTCQRWVFLLLVW